MLNTNDFNIVFNSKFYKEFCVKKEKILEYKWLESEKAGHDIGLEKAWLQWETKHYKDWHCFFKNS